MGNFAIRAIMQVLGGGICRVHHLTLWVVCRRFPRLPHAGKAKSRLLPIPQAIEDLSTNETNWGTENPSHDIRMSEE